MFDLRYHVVSLTAVFVALAAGIILGVALSGKLSTAEEALSAAQVAELSRQLESERDRAEAAERRGEAAEELIEKAYPVLMEERLAGKEFAVLFLGPVDGDLRSSIERTLADADAGGAVRMIALDLPLEPDALDEALLAREELADYAGDDFTPLGRDLAEELLEGGDALWSVLSAELVGERSGTPAPAVDGAIVVRSWTPNEGAVEAEQERRNDATQTLVDGLLQGLRDGGVPAVGVERSTSEASAIGLYRERGLSSVDDVDTPAGRVALALLLAGAEPGHYGVKDSASDGVVPPIEPLDEASAG